MKEFKSFFRNHKNKFIQIITQSKRSYAGKLVSWNKSQIQLTDPMMMEFVKKEPVRDRINWEFLYIEIANIESWREINLKETKDQSTETKESKPTEPAEQEPTEEKTAAQEPSKEEPVKTAIEV